MRAYSPFWNATTNVYCKCRIVERNVTSALITEDDVDWDIRLKEQMKKFALSSQALTQPLYPEDDLRYADHTFLDPSKDLIESLQPMHLVSLPKTRPPQFSPYGDDWDLLWLGHCAQRVPALANPRDAKQRAETWNIPRGHVIFEDDTTPDVSYRHNYNDKDIMPFRSYPGKSDTHTRIFHHAMDGRCATAYAVSHRGARKLLFQAGVQSREEPFDFMLQRFCGSDPTSTTKDYERDRDLAEKLRQRQRNICLTVQPPLFGQTKLEEATKDGDDKKGIFGNLLGWGKDLDQASTVNVRQSIRLNLRKLVNGETDYTDQWPDPVL